MDSDLRLGQIAVRMGLIQPHELQALLREARAGHTEESAGGATALGQVLMRRQLCTVSDYLYMARQAREEAAAEAERRSDDGPPTMEQLEGALMRLESGELEPREFERLLASSGEPIPRDRKAPARFARYELLSEIARGGMGIVYRARDTLSDQVVALKVMIEADDDEVRLQRFEAEAQLAAALDHPNIVKIHDAGREDGIPYFTMDLVDGDSLDNLLDQQQVARDVVLRALAQVARAVDHAHSRGIVHRDLKPGNILLDKRSGQARITDFGLARDLARVTRLTQVGQAVGTPYYMAPEQVRGERDVDGRCDVYAIGVILYEVLTGDVPFDADSPLSLFKKIDREPVDLPLDPARGIDERIHKVVLRALAKDRDERYSRGALLAQDLERYLDGKEPRALPRAPLDDLRARWLHDRVALAAVLLGAVAVAVLVAAGVLGWRRLEARRQREAARAQVQDTVDQAASAREAAAKALEGGAAAGALQHAEQGLALLEGVAGLLGAGGPVEEGGGEAWHQRKAPGVQADLRALEARALALLSDGDPELRDRARDALVRAVQGRPRDVPLRLLLARRHEAEGRLSEALAELDEVLEVEPGHLQALVSRGRVCLHLDRPDPALLSLSQALRADPTNADALVLRAEASLAAGRLDAARSDARDAAKADPSRIEPPLILGLVARARGQVAEAAACYAEAARQHPDDPRPHLRQGELLLERGAAEDARDAFSRALDRGGGAPAGLGHAEALAVLGEPAAARVALEAAEAAVDRLPPSQRAAMRARVLVELGEVSLLAGEDATEALGRAREAARAGSPEHVAATVWLARLRVEAGAPDRAQALLDELPADRREGSADVLEVAARAALDRGKAADARDLAERALAASGAVRHPRARRTLALARQAMGQDEPARAACAAAWEDGTWGGDLASEHVRRAIELVALGRPGRRGVLLEAAERLLAGSLRLDPRQARAWLARHHLDGDAGHAARAHALDRFQPEVALALGRAAAAPGAPREQAAEAESALELALTFDARNPELLLAVARCRLALDEVVPALAAADLAAKQAPDRAEVHEVLAEALARAGRDEEGRAARERAAACRDRVARLLERARGTDAAALAAAREAAALGDPLRDAFAREAGLRAGALETERMAALEALARVLLAPGPDALPVADAALAALWREPLAEDRRRVLLLQATEAPADAHLAVALAALHDGLAGPPPDPAWLEQALPHAVAAVRDAPGSVAAHAARAWLRVRTGDVARARRELEALAVAAPESALVQFLLAEALAAQGQAAGAKEALQRCQGALPRYDERVNASPFLR